MVSEKTSLRKRYPLRTWLSIAGILIGLGVLIPLSRSLYTLFAIQNADFIEYWSAGRLNITGQNPYSLEQMADLQIPIGRKPEWVMLMWNPPWSVILVEPFGILDYPTSRILWYLVETAVMFWITVWLWMIVGGKQRQLWLALGIAFTFGSTLDILKWGQINAFVFLGVVGFVVLVERERDYLAGAMLCMAAIKPHRVYLIGLAVLLWCIQTRRWKVIAGAVLSAGVAIGLAMITNPSLIPQYLRANAEYPPVMWITASVGAILRMNLGPEKFWLQFIAPAVGGLGFLVYWFWKRPAWQWSPTLPMLAAVSAATAAYGWQHDQILLLPLVLQASVWFLRPGKIGIKILMGSLYWVVNLYTIVVVIPQYWFWWVPFWWIGWYIVCLRSFGPRAPGYQAASPEVPVRT